MPIPEYIRQIRTKIGHDLLYMPGVIAVINNAHGQTLLQRRSDNGLWSLVGGIPDPGEEPANALAREVLEETGMIVRPTRLVGIYSEADGAVHYPNGDVMMFLSVIFECEPIRGEPRVTDDESLEVRYFAPDQLPEMDARHKRYLLQALQNTPQTHFVFTFTADEEA
ncbi:MAG: NUDIX domain-containing protein [Chloroflexi bacterium CFX4]|nr:NUDIX domain-containing protein [Chloroflexi bacterium CFX4]MDL1923680.1 NUDIX domain-containing protein [Chloroflexi bacterium CFX3]